MNKIEQQHYNSISKEYLNSFYEGKLTEMDCEKVASKSAEITGQIAVEFAGWIGNHSYQKTVDGLWTNNWGISQDTTKELYQKFLKTQK